MRIARDLAGFTLEADGLRKAIGKIGAVDKQQEN